MAYQKALLNIKIKHVFGLAALLVTGIVCAAFNFTGNNSFDMARQEILLRKIGHEVLLHSGDSTSRVLPVTRVTDNEYQIRFENEFTFQTDSLVKIIGQELAKNTLSRNYIVNVLDCAKKDVIFGYAVSKNKKEDLMACSGRKQPKSCYLIDIRFQTAGISTMQKTYLIAGIPILAFIGLVIARTAGVRKNKNESHAIKIGRTLFDPQKRSLICDEIITELTAKENKLLLIFAHLPDTVIERGRLQKEIWEDEGVIVGRSLDMFISKLRKKLERDTTIQLINIHGKGYKLEMIS